MKTLKDVGLPGASCTRLILSVQVVEAAARGVQAAILPVGGSDGGEHTLQDLVLACNSLNLLPIIEVSSEEEIGAAVQAGAQALLVKEVESLETSMRLFEKIPKQVVSLCSIGGMQEDCAELEQAAASKIVGYDGVVISQAARSVGDVEYVEWILSNLTSKRSKAVEFSIQEFK
ncbi:hypothetical protein GUITHDRAFT_106203 [Guillardia theta CCMP2712]|uniref:Uncharacterized protein n=1 Tax=Guillardia theta (strain CCMP2712) TaxID=905079 RepID=L1JI01_GUITC|nr:hypothetical protein GUITHDRAFT_106203 [Guillardia theta CCMP2712]EKX48126.1 hypothetical protein GUITHDRAFT_106203 [Guillardia theta CCMP2712]|eukprot:XP_005835106.1 hypothetical protein GUITHDRAFT_106203 [Guillardia theta CCMP2712]